MNRLLELFRIPLPHLTAGKALLLRMLMFPNLFLIRVEGALHLEAVGSKPCIFAFNHNNAFESLFVPVLLFYLRGGRTVSFVIDWMFGRLPVVGWLMKLIDPVYVHHKRSTMPFLERKRQRAASSSSRGECIERLVSGKSIGIFPEGTRNPDPFTLLKAKPGIGYIALESGVPVMPVGIEFITKRHCERVPSVGRIVVRFGRPMEFNRELADYRSLPAEGQRSRKSELAREVAEQVMLSISVLCGKVYLHGSQKSESIKTDNQTMEALCPS
ncbi:MAG TPA: 1-acyl-sn-glycerol-3-phosphate acyltransferase [Chlorobaculum parvum]|uniref:1-acyl-sn-glycerol-3-phosphate acyltransferase n=1 Tax=Chlorobaculum parvum TaxID=274539 RepID=A0A7C5HCJ2_9CHLB|nr:1-acyl-sn-glycerol-3-phosphate acyltransferase [Chlorobaculum parvum]